MATDREIDGVLEILACVYDQKPLTDKKKSVYRRLLADIDGKLLHAAAVRAINQWDEGKGDWFPSIARLRYLSLQVMTDAVDMPTPGEAWAEVCQQIAAVGHTGHPEFSNQMIRDSVAAAGGWYTLCMSENAMADRARFQQAYDQLLQKRLRQQNIAPQERRQLESFLTQGNLPKGLKPRELSDA